MQPLKHTHTPCWCIVISDVSPLGWVPAGLCCQGHGRTKRETHEDGETGSSLPLNTSRTLRLTGLILAPPGNL